jgi:hypothetical protein
MFKFQKGKLGNLEKTDGAENGLIFILVKFEI